MNEVNEIIISSAMSEEKKTGGDNSSDHNNNEKLEKSLTKFVMIQLLCSAHVP